MQLLQRRDLRRAEDRFGVGGPAKAPQIGWRDVVDVERQDLEGQFGIGQTAPAAQRRRIDLRVVGGQVEAAVGRQPFEQDVGKAPRRGVAARADVFHAMSGATASLRPSSGRRGSGFAGPLGSPPWGGAPKALRGGSIQFFLADLDDRGQHRGQRLHQCQRGLHAPFHGVVGEDDDVGLVLALGAFALQQRVDRDVVVGQDAGDARQHAGLVGHHQAQVEGGHDFVDGQDRRVLHRAALEGQVRHAVVGVGGVQARDVDQVGHDGAGRGFCARALAVVERRADSVALHDDRVHRAFDVGDQPRRRHQRRVHAQLDAMLTALGDAQQLDAVAQLLGITDVHRLQRADALDMRLVELHRHAKGDGAHDGRLVGGIDALDVEGGVGFGVAQALRLLEHDAEVEPLRAHLGQDEVGGAVDDAGDPFDAVRGQALAQRLDDRDAAGHGGFERDHHALVAGGGEDLAAMHREQRLVGRHHVLAGGNRLQHQGARDAIAADQLDHDVDRRVVDHQPGIGDHLRPLANDGACTLGVEVGHHRDLDATPGAALDFLLVAMQHLEGAAADGADAQ